MSKVPQTLIFTFSVNMVDFVFMMMMFLDIQLADRQFTCFKNCFRVGKVISKGLNCNLNEAFAFFIYK